eukprot:5503279-Pleurochrysis_carterae.AAC.1
MRLRACAHGAEVSVRESAERRRRERSEQGGWKGASRVAAEGGKRVSAWFGGGVRMGLSHTHTRAR